jgi:hypothetical protein
MREARYVSLIPQTTLHSDSEQYIQYFVNLVYILLSHFIYTWKVKLEN